MFNINSDFFLKSYLFNNLVILWLMHAQKNEMLEKAQL
jgi:hypothetical protein